LREEAGACSRVFGAEAEEEEEEEEEKKKKSSVLLCFSVLCFPSVSQSSVFPLFFKPLILSIFL
jgi:hypothetical protein